MQYKLIVASVDDRLVEKIVKAAREAGATGDTVITQARGDGLTETKTFFGLNLDVHRDVVLFLVQDTICDDVLSAIDQAGKLDEQKGAGVAFVVDVEKAVGLSHHFAQATQDADVKE